MGDLLPLGCTAWVSTPHSWCSGYTVQAVAARNATVTDATGRVVIETVPYSVMRFHYGAWIGMSILAAVLLILCALFAGLTLAVCGLDRTLLQLKCITGTPKERYEDIVRAVLDCADHRLGDMPIWSLA
jgi:uncharacterized membrane protein